jgi:hypothetical protein
LQDLARTMLIHANRQWEMSVNAHLWPYAVRMASNQVTNTPRMQSLDKKSLMQQFAKTKLQTNIKHWHPFGSPVYVLESELQKQGIFGKWKSQANIGIYLGRSPHHSRNVALVLTWQTGLVSPQFHVQHDHCYHTVREERQKEPDLWMIKAGFVGSKEVAAAASRQAKRGASMPLQVDCGKRTRLDDRQEVVRAEGADSPKEAQTEGARPEGAAAPEEEGFHQDADSVQHQRGQHADGENQSSWQGSARGKQHAEDNRMSRQGSTEGKVPPTEAVLTRSGRTSKMD